MKFLTDRPFRIQAAYLLAVLFILSLGQFFFLRWKFISLDDYYNQVAFTRTAQRSFQQIIILATQQTQDEDISAKIQESIDLQEYHLKVIGEGGRIEGTRNVFKNLSPLTKATYDELIRNWNTYKESLSLLNTGSESVRNTERIKRRVKSQWLSVSAWYDRLISDLEGDLHEARSGFHGWLLTIILSDLVFCLLIYFLLTQKILKPLKTLELNASNQVHTPEFEKHEIGNLATHVNDVIEQLKDASHFVQTISEGNLSMNYQELDKHYTPGKNVLADALIRMQAKLITMNEEEQRRQWANEGLTKFVDILRASGDNISSLADKIISALVHYTRSNQGGLYILNEDDPNDKFLELISLFAFDTKKFEKQRLKLGEGILGQTFLEKETTYLTEIPQEYIRIRSGLGDAIPKALLAVPLKIDKQVYGVVELASFNEFEQHEISFVERLGETIASTLATVKAAQRTSKLLESSEMATEQMRAQEEEMRQNMEELQATQEEMGRKEKEMSRQLEQSIAIQAELKANVGEIERLKEENQRDSSSLMALYEKYKRDLTEILNQIPAKIFLKDSKGYIVLCNQELADSYSLPIEKLVGTHDRDHFDPEQVKIWAGQEMEIIRDGKKTFVQEERLNDKIRYYKTTKMPFTIHHLDQVGIMGFQIDVTDTIVAQQTQGEGDDWGLAEEVEKALKMNLEALRITQEQLNRKG